MNTPSSRATKSARRSTTTRSKAKLLLSHKRTGHAGRQLRRLVPEPRVRGDRRGSAVAAGGSAGAGRVPLRGDRVAACHGAVWRPSRSCAAIEPEAGLRERTFNEWSASVGLLLKPQAANDNFVIALNLARASRYPSLEELYYFGPHPGNLSFESATTTRGRARAGLRPIAARPRQPVRRRVVVLPQRHHELHLPPADRRRRRTTSRSSATSRPTACSPASRRTATSS